MAVIEMTNAPGLLAQLDDADHGYFSQWTWYVDSKGYAKRDIQVAGRKYPRKLHRLVADAPDGVIVDHINGDKLDNRRENLRLVTPRQNCLNRSANKGRKYKGVYKNHKAATYTARINADGKSRYLGSFRDPIDAAKAYDEAAKEYFGDYARLNFPE